MTAAQGNIIDVFEQNPSRVAGHRLLRMYNWRIWLMIGPIFTYSSVTGSICVEGLDVVEGNRLCWMGDNE
jgi:hypothetical protein